MGAGTGHSALGLMSYMQLFAALPTRVVAVELDANRYHVLQSVMKDALKDEVGRRCSHRGWFLYGELVEVAYTDHPPNSIRHSM